MNSSYLLTSIMDTPIKKVIAFIAVLIVGVLVGLAIPSIIQKSQDFDNYAKAREAAPDKEEFDRNFDAMVEWFDDYRRDNPGATDEDAQEAFEELWSQN